MLSPGWHDTVTAVPPSFVPCWIGGDLRTGVPPPPDRLVHGGGPDRSERIDDVERGPLDRPNDDVSHQLSPFRAEG